MLSARLNTLHNLYFYQQLMREIRETLAAGHFAAFARPFLTQQAVERAEENLW
jgi:queuine tRNA-ribosyltransferase